MSDLNTPYSKALRYISHMRFHRRFHYGDLTITYADIGRAGDTTILFMPGMFASRYLAIPMHAIAENLGCSFGMGNSTNVPIEKRVSAWLDLVPRLLDHLHIDHVALVSHSSGTIYLLNTLYYCRGVLHPKRPYVALFAPWVNPSHSHVISMQLAQFLPAKAFSVWNRVPRFMLLKAAPVMASSGAVIAKVSGLVSSEIFRSESWVEKNRRRIEEKHGLEYSVQTELEPLIYQFLFEESTEGANLEALQCLQKGPPGSWGKCEDYREFVRELVELERRGGRCIRESVRGKLVVRAYFAESDAMIGKRGQLYVEECWKGKVNGEFLDVLDFETRTVLGSDHDTVSLHTETLERVFLESAGRLAE
ncbi:hypothetical protein EYZ11_009765 [Aspergillus tanneri]|uniref:AB hydrolase-1 domain-containing protein n=1 Tax=Aspergillus tanneri TaxID=1220188 RepID=A0A4S3J7A8_9EURO|nr:hypothetical protein EYZ11_009765 [Aspergillus tanneri]